METHVCDSCIRGHHISKDFWTPVINEELVCAQESGNSHDPYAVAIKKGSVVVGHVPRKISAICSLFLRVKTITATVTDSHRQYSNDLPQGGVEVPCVFKFCGEAKTIDKVRRLLPANNEQDSDKPPPLKKVKLLSEAILKLSRVQNYFWWIKYWQMTLKIPNRQSLLLANISSCTVY